MPYILKTRLTSRHFSTIATEYMASGYTGRTMDYYDFNAVAGVSYLCLCVKRYYEIIINIAQYNAP